MKKIILLAVIAFAAAACEKETDPQNGTVTFYTTSAHRYSIIIDGVECGNIKNTSQMPVCGDPAFWPKTLSAGKHTVDAKSLDGYAWGNPKTINVKANDCIQVSMP